MQAAVSTVFFWAAWLAAILVTGPAQAASASEHPSEASGSPRYEAAQPDQWQAGLMTFAVRSPFAGDGTYVRVLPALSYRSRHLFLAGLQAGYHVLPGNEAPLSLDLLAALRLRPGENRKQASLDAGLRLGYWLAGAQITLTVRQDVSGVHGGQEVTLGVGTRVPLGALTLMPSVEAEWQSRSLANHLWGTSLSDHRRATVDGLGDALPVYRLDGSVLNYGATLLTLYKLDRNWRLTGLIKASRLGNSAAENPGIVHRLDLRGGLGLSYAF